MCPTPRPYKPNTMAAVNAVVFLGQMVALWKVRLHPEDYKSCLWRREEWQWEGSLQEGVAGPLDQAIYT